MSKSTDKNYPGRTVRRDGNQIVVTIPVKFYRRNGRQTVKAEPNTDNGQNELPPDVNTTLASLIAKAYAWQDELESGVYSSIEELAEEKKVGRTYACRVMRLTSLCPEIVERILNGDESHGLSLRQLHKGIPDCWKQQMDLFGRLSIAKVRRAAISGEGYGHSELPQWEVTGT